MNTDEEILFHHALHSPHQGELEGADVLCADGNNPLCGDHIVVYARTRESEGQIHLEDFKFAGRGCVVSQAATSLLIDVLRGKSATEAAKIIGRLQHSLRSKESIDIEELQPLREIYKFPARLRCALLGAEVIAEIIAQMDRAEQKT